MDATLKEPEVWSLMRAAFPGIENDVGEIGAGLVHLEFAELRRRLEVAAAAGKHEPVTRILAFVEDLLGRAIHEEVDNAIHVSFVEDLYVEQHLHAFVAPLLPARLRAKWDAVAGDERTRSST